VDSAHYLYQRQRQSQELNTGKMLENHNQRCLEMRHASLDVVSFHLEEGESCLGGGFGDISEKWKFIIKNNC
jgi:hypothetical protein